MEESGSEGGSTSEEDSGLDGSEGEGDSDVDLPSDDDPDL